MPIGIPNDKQTLVNVDQQVSSSDLNAVSSLLYQIIRNSNLNITSESNVVISGLAVTYTSGNTINISAGVALFSVPQTVSTYAGSIYYLNSPVSPTIAAADHTNNRIDGIDIQYTEVQGTSQTRNVINPGTGVISPTSVNTQILSTYNIQITTGTPSGSPVAPAIPSGFVRLATYEVPFNSGGTVTVTNITKITQLMFENQTFPGTPNTANQSSSIADNLAAIRAQLNSIIGGSNWYNVIPINLTQLTPNFVTASSVSGTLTNYNPTGFNSNTTSLQIATNGATVLTGLIAGINNQRLVITNTGTAILKITIADSTSSSANQFLAASKDTACYVYPNDSMTFRYDTTLTKWCFLSKDQEPMPHYKNRKWWSVVPDANGSISSSMTSVGISGFTTSGTSSFVEANASSIGMIIFFEAGDGGCLLTVPNLNTVVVFPMSFTCKLTGFSGVNNTQAFVGFSSSNPILNSTDPLASKIGFGIWFKSNGTTFSVSFVHNDGSASSVIVSSITGASQGTTTSAPFTYRVDLTSTGIVHQILDSTPTVTTSVSSSSTQVPPATSGSSAVIKPYVYLLGITGSGVDSDIFLQYLVYEY